ncbi:hypothetical protein KJ708_12100 [bacterium]|nr:hypothetical protein [bacterium]
MIQKFDYLRTKPAAVLPQELTPDLMKNNMLPTMVITQEGKLPTGVVSKETEVNEGKQRITNKVWFDNGVFHYSFHFQ